MQLEEMGDSEMCSPMSCGKRGESHKMHSLGKIIGDGENISVTL